METCLPGPEPEPRPQGWCSCVVFHPASPSLHSSLTSPLSKHRDALFCLKPAFSSLFLLSGSGAPRLRLSCSPGSLLGGRLRGPSWGQGHTVSPCCLPVSKGNCTTKAPRAWNSAWGCFGYIEVFASVLPDLNGDFTSTELKRRRGRRASPGERERESQSWAQKRRASA